MKVTKTGKLLHMELNKALNGSAFIPYDRLKDVSLLIHRAKRYNTKQEQACSYEYAQGNKWDKQEKLLENSIVELATSLPGIVGVTFSGDPRGYTVRLLLVNKAYNSIGGVEDGYGIA